ncbi:MAG: PRK06851 family protein [Syntrophomonas sp.]|uniref:PRK06851 family protein n=1 Tax=Syntrophomonas sp. TaxID=2053627 RepID=UPI00262E7B30|nr:PRK06851 family protein [Syntrophomonas sp.]MDD2509627.1 PRK06851 family protein [Syntrophomonas sp.]MDD3879789.1 PRK06851 family protein [Syntrophomonas sp.]MDD4625711.1 PRK06851 family protein [Syntrophomonas sp.]
MGKLRHMYPGANSCRGFYSFYQYMLWPEGERKIILKGGPGVGKSTFMKKIGEEFSSRGLDLEYHWCSSDNQSLDGVVIGQKVCILDGTAPHVVDPLFPGAVDEILNLGDFWDSRIIKEHKNEVIKLGQEISRCFARAYLRLQEAAVAYEEWQSYYKEARDLAAVKRNILALSQEFLQGCSISPYEARHLFAAAITPAGPVTRIESLVDNDYSLYAIKGSPGSGIKELLDHVAYMLKLQQFYGEVYHSPFEPQEIDLIILPERKTALLDLSSCIVNYGDRILAKQKRLLDFDELIQRSLIDPHARRILGARNRFDKSLQEAVEFIRTAKQYHDELESLYIPAMDFAALENLWDTRGQFYCVP